MSMKIFSDLRILNLCVCGQWIAVSMNKFYPFQLWLTTLGIGPILYVLYGLLSSNQNEASEIFALYPLFLIIGLIYSIPLFLIFYIFFRLCSTDPILIGNKGNSGHSVGNRRLHYIQSYFGIRSIEFEYSLFFWNN